MSHFAALRRVLCLSMGALWASLGSAAISNVQVLGSTSTQAILAYTAPDEKPCTIEVSESANYYPVVPDVDSQLFPGAQLDQRPGSIAIGQQRLVVIGKRAAEIASNGRRYSRALQANTTHYYRITCNYDQATGTFPSANIPIGKAYGEILPADRDHPGQYAWPEMVWTDGNPRIVDPSTGLLFKPLTRPNLVGQRVTNQPFQAAVDLGGQGEWSTPGGALSKSGSVYAGTNQSWLYLRTAGVTAQGGTSWTEFGYSFNYFQVIWKAAGGPIDVCLTVNGVTCASAIRQVTLPASAGNVTVGTQDANLAYWSDATHILNRTDLVRRTGYVNVDENAVVTYGSGDTFNLGWTAGSLITIGKAECRIVGVGNNRLLTIDTASCSSSLNLPLSGATYTADNFGVLVRKSAPGTGRVSIQSAVYQYGTVEEPGWASGAHTLYCADRLVADTSDPPQYGYHCSLYGLTYWINPTTAEARFLGVPYYLSTTVSGDRVQGCWVDAAAFDPNNPNRFYCLSKSSGGQSVILRGEYSGDHTDLGAVDLASAQIKANWTNLTPASQGRDLTSLVARFDPDFDPASFNNCIARGASANGALLITCMRGSQDTIGWEIVFDTASAQVVAAYKSWDKLPGRWCKLHSSAPVIGSDAWARIEFSLNGDSTDAGAGAWLSQITSGAIAADALQDCPPNPFGVSGTACLAVTVRGEPCDFSPNKTEQLNCPYDSTGTYLMNAQPGDLFQIDSEWVRLLAKDGNQWLLQRNFQNLGIAAHAANRNLMAMCSTNPFDDITLWNFRDDPHGYNTNGKTVQMDLTITDHSSVTKTAIQGSAVWRDCPQGANGSCLSIRTGNDVGDWVSQPASPMPWSGPTFAGQRGVWYGNFIESYSSFPPTSPTATDRSWFLYNRPLTSDSNLTQLTNVTGQLYQVKAALPLHRKILPTLAMCGVHPMVDVSGPASIIGSDDSDAYRYCVAGHDGECTDSMASRQTTAGDIYVNCPRVGVPVKSACTGDADDRGVCIADNGSYVQSIVQVSNQLQNANGQSARVLTNSFRPYRAGQTYWNSRVLPDGSWALLWTPWFNLQRPEAFLAKLPPFPAPDTVDRTTFEPMDLWVPGMDAASSVVVEFGYAENGPADKLYCTSRQETCVRGNQSDSDFGFASDTVTPVDCKGGCTVRVPAIPGRVLYYRARYLDDSQQTVTVGSMGATVVP